MLRKLTKIKSNQHLTKEDIQCRKDLLVDAIEAKRLELGMSKADFSESLGVDPPLFTKITTPNYQHTATLTLIIRYLSRYRDSRILDILSQAGTR